jgi:hypothetical protein
MNSRGEHRATAAAGIHSRVPRTAAALLVVATVATAATWAEVHYAGGGQAAQAANSSTSQDSVPAAGASGGAQLPPLETLSYQDVLPASVSQFAPPSSAAGTGTTVSAAIGTGAMVGAEPYQATLYAGTDEHGDCADAFTGTAPDAATKSCTGYLTGDYVQQDHAVYTSVTVLLYPDHGSAAAAAAAITQPPQSAPAAVAFREPGSGLPELAAPAATPAGVRIQVVGSAVDVVQSADATVQPVPESVTVPTWYVSYTVGTEPDLTWQ